MVKKCTHVDKQNSQVKQLYLIGKNITYHHKFIVPISPNTSHCLILASQKFCISLSTWVFHARIAAHKSAREQTTPSNCANCHVLCSPAMSRTAFFLTPPLFSKLLTVLRCYVLCCSVLH